MEILSNTMGVDFAPYLQTLLRKIYSRWLTQIPPAARAPQGEAGTTVIRLRIDPVGQLAALNLDGSSHDESLNRAAWASITSAAPFPPLPSEFTGPFLEFRIHFLVNKEAKTAVAAPSSSAPTLP